MSRNMLIAVVAIALLIAVTAGAAGYMLGRQTANGGSSTPVLQEKPLFGGR